MKLFRVGCPRIMLYDDDTFTARKLFVMVNVNDTFIVITSSVMAPIGNTASLENPTKGVRDGKSL